MNADKQIADILSRHGEDFREATWRVQGQAVIYHKALERIAVQASITFDVPTIIRAERDEAVMLVVGRMGDRLEWSVGECVVNVNYRVSGRQAAYVWAMAEKRAKDRVILKLINLHGLLYSEEEADDFKSDARPNGAEPVKSSIPVKAAEPNPPLDGIERSANPHQARKAEDWEKVLGDLIEHAQDSGRLLLWAKTRSGRLAGHPWRKEALERWRDNLGETLAMECHSVRDLVRWREESHAHTSVLPVDWQLAASAVWEAAKARTAEEWARITTRAQEAAE